MSAKSIASKARGQEKGILRLSQNWEPSSFCVKRRLSKFHPDDYYPLGGEISHREYTRWVRFKSWIFSHLRKTEYLAELYAEAKVAKEENEAWKTAEEAADIDARKDLKRLKELQRFNAIVDDIFANDGIPPEAKVLKLAKLFEIDPEVLTQIDKVKNVIKKIDSMIELNVRDS